MDIVLADNAWKPFQLVGDSLRLAARVISNVGTLVTQGWPQGMTRHREKAGWLLGISPATVARVIGIANATNGTLEVEHPDRGKPLKKIQEMHIFKIKDYLRRRAMLGRWTGIKDLQHFLSRGGGWVPQEDEGEGPRGKPRATKAPPGQDQGDAGDALSFEPLVVTDKTLRAALKNAGMKFGCGRIVCVRVFDPQVVAYRNKYARDFVANLINSKGLPKLPICVLDESYKNAGHTRKKVWLDESRINLAPSGAGELWCFIGAGVYWAEDNNLKASWVKDSFVLFRAGKKASAKGKGKGYGKGKGKAKTSSARVVLSEDSASSSLESSSDYEESDEPAPFSNFSDSSDEAVVQPPPFKAAKTNGGSKSKPVLVSYVPRDLKADYHGNMDGERFQLCFENICINLRTMVGPSVILMDGAGYHKEQLAKAPNKSASKVAMQHWLTANQIDHDKDLSKDELYALILKHKAERVQYKARVIAEKYGHQIWFTPPYSPWLQPIERIWNSIKWPLTTDISRTMTQLGAAILESKSKVTEQNWIGAYWAMIDEVYKITESLEDDPDNTQDPLGIGEMNLSESDNED